MSKATTQAATRSPELAALLEHQAAVRAAQAEIGKLQTAIVGCEQRLAEARAHRPSVDALTHDLENLRAAAALGEVTATEARQREEAIASERARLEKAAGGVDGEIAEIERTRAGLQRRLEEAQAKLETSTARKPEALQAFLLSEAEAICADYVEAGRVVRECYLKLLTLQGWLRFRAGFVSDNILGNSGEELLLPAFNLPQCAGLGHPGWAWGSIWFHGRNYVQKAQEETEETEAARLRALGVTLE